MIPIWKFSGRLGNQMFQLAYLYNQVKVGNLPDIYVQDEKYFKDVVEEVRTIFSQGSAGYTDKVSLHVRRGDYVNHPFYVNLTETDYYKDAMALFPGEKFLVFSDDIEWCKQHFIGDQFDFYHESEVEDMNMMSSCKHNIIANSTFSWWAAWLNSNPMKRVVAPKAWHPDEIERTIIPQEWTRL